MPIAPLAVAALLAAAPDAPKPGTSLTVYSSADPAGFDPRQFVQQQRASGMDNVWGVPGYGVVKVVRKVCLLYTSPSPRDLSTSRMPSSA